MTAKKTSGAAKRTGTDKAKKQPAKESTPKTRRGGYRGYRDKDGLTPRQRLDLVKGDREKLKLETERGNLVPRDDVISERRMVAEVLSSDLLSLGIVLSTRLAKCMSPAQVRKAVDAQVVDMMKRWKSGNTIDTLTCPHCGREIGTGKQKRKRPGSAKRTTTRGRSAATT